MAETFILLDGKTEIEISGHNAYERKWTEFILPSGSFYAWQNRPVEVKWRIIPKAYAQDMTVKEQIILYIKQISAKYGVDENKIINTIKCESNFTINAKGRAGEVGIAQFMPKTFEMFKKDFGNSEMSIYDWKNQIELMVKAFKRGLANHWTCYKYDSRTL